jgi:hypothetical protein
MPKGFSVHSSAVYQIRLQGVLEKSWQESIDNLRIISFYGSEKDQVPQTILIGKVRDQAALAGVLNLVNNLGLPLLDVQCLGLAVDGVDPK